MGSIHIDYPVNNIVVDKEMKRVYTPAYMLAKRVTEVAEGINKLVNKIVEMEKNIFYNIYDCLYFPPPNGGILSGQLGRERHEETFFFVQPSD